jgi:hypothetical protein
LAAIWIVNTAGDVGLPFRSMSLIENERTKLTAAYLNGLAIAIFAIGALAPSFRTFTIRIAKPAWLIALVGSVCILISGALHLIARSRLGTLPE